MSVRRWGWGIAPVVLLMGCAGAGDTAGTKAPLIPVCAEDPGQVPEQGWVCPDALTVECDGGDGTASVESIYVILGLPEESAACDGQVLTVSDPGPFAVGEHTIVVGRDVPEADAGAEVLCEATLTVVDTVAPVATDRVVTLWPPNHSMHALTPDDCVAVEDACDGVVHARFTWAQSDEPADDLGDGRTEPDVVLGCDAVELRAERQGGGDGRVYRLGYVAEDGAGNPIEGSCTVVVPHDQSGAEAVEGPPAYQVTVADGCG